MLHPVARRTDNKIGQQDENVANAEIASVVFRPPLIAKDAEAPVVDKKAETENATQRNSLRVRPVRTS